MQINNSAKATTNTKILAKQKRSTTVSIEVAGVETHR
jgi:hypothetical protein